METLLQWAAEFSKLARGIWKHLPRKTVVPTCHQTLVECFPLLPFGTNYPTLSGRDGRLSWPKHHECKWLAQGYCLIAAILVGIEPAASESLVPDLTTMPPRHPRLCYCRGLLAGLCVGKMTRQVLVSCHEDCGWSRSLHDKHCAWFWINGQNGIWSLNSL